MNLIAMLLRDNWHAFRDINGLAGHHPLVDALMVFSANDLIVALPLLLLGFWFLFARWSPLMRRAATQGMQATQGTPQDDAGRRLGQRMALLGCGAVALALACNLALGQLLYEPRPFVSHPRTDHLLISHPADASFPSDHEAVAGAVAAILVLYVLLALGRWVRSVRHTTTDTTTQELPLLGAPMLVAMLVASAAVLAAFTIGFARVYVGVHYPLDIAGGLGCGVFAALLVTLVSPLLTPLLNVLIQFADRLRLS